MILDNRNFRFIFTASEITMMTTPQILKISYKLYQFRKKVNILLFLVLFRTLRNAFGVVPLKDECGICHRVLSVSWLRKCERCKRLYCRDCMVADVATGDPTVLLCLHCARRVVSPRVTSKYEGLTAHLRFRAAFTGQVKLTLARIDGLIGTNLPIEAYRNETWWSNSKSSAHAKGWLDAGWEVQEVNLKEGTITFRKTQTQPVKRVKRKKREEITKPFTPVPARPLRSKVPSKTKASKLYARILNRERQRNAGYQSGLSSKHRSAHERRLFGSNEKPH